MKKYKFLILSLIFLLVFTVSIWAAMSFGIIGVVGGLASRAPENIAWPWWGVISSFIIAFVSLVLSIVFAVMSLLRKEGRVVFYLAPLVVIGLLVSLFSFLR